MRQNQPLFFVYYMAVALMNKQMRLPAQYLHHNKNMKLGSGSLERRGSSGLGGDKTEQ